MSVPLVEFRNVHKSFGPLVVLDGVNLTLARGESLVIIGVSGSGKSVMLKHVVGLLNPDAGEVYYDGVRIDTLTEKQLMTIRHRIGFLFQMSALFDSLTVGENIAFPIREHTSKDRDEIAQIVTNRLGLVGLPDIERKMPAELSGGQRKRVALARAIALEPELILYDEPTTGLDPIRADVINELILKLQRELHAAAITVTHDMNSAFKVADRIVMLHEGKIIIDGTPEQIKSSDNSVVRRFVLGEADAEDLMALQGDI
jgi:phospholipid/cholesterol/gamma-HCH transport system ATP-binding protein